MVSALKRLNYVYTLASLRTYASSFPICSSLTLEGVFPRELPHSSEIEQASWHCYRLGNLTSLHHPVSEFKVLRIRKVFPSNQ
jgi:hypothetical protein